VNVSEYYEKTTLEDLGLKSSGKNTFEIHEKEGPPKRLRIDEFGSASNNNNKRFIGPKPVDESYWMEDEIVPVLETGSYNRASAEFSQQLPISQTGPARRNALFDQEAMSSSLLASNSNETVYFVGLINQAMTCYLNSLLQTLYMTPEFRNAIYRLFYKLGWVFRPRLKILKKKDENCIMHHKTFIFIQYEQHQLKVINLNFLSNFLKCLTEPTKI